MINSPISVFSPPSHCFSPSNATKLLNDCRSMPFFLGLAYLVRQTFPRVHDFGIHTLPKEKPPFFFVQQKNLGFFSNIVQNDLGLDVNKLPLKLRMKVQAPLVALDWLYKKWS